MKRINLSIGFLLFLIYSGYASEFLILGECDSKQIFIFSEIAEIDTLNWLVFNGFAGIGNKGEIQLCSDSVDYKFYQVANPDTSTIRILCNTELKIVYLYCIKAKPGDYMAWSIPTPRPFGKFSTIHSKIVQSYFFWEVATIENLPKIIGKFKKDNIQILSNSIKTTDNIYGNYSIEKLLIIVDKKISKKEIVQKIEQSMDKLRMPLSTQTPEISSYCSVKKSSIKNNP